MPNNSNHTGNAILIVEDNEDLRENASLVLTLEGYKVFLARDGQEALQLLTGGQCRPDLIVSDIAMPNMDGYQFFEEIHKIPELRVVPFIFLTARGSPSDIRLGKQMGADDYLPKPFNADDFLVAVANKLQRTHEIREHAENALDDARRDMVQLISHELRTPITYVAGGFSLLAEHLEQDELPGDIQISMNLIHNGTERLNRLAEQMVAYAEQLSGHAQMQLDSFGTAYNLEVLVRDMIITTQRELSEQRARIQFDVQWSEPVEVFTVPEILGTAIYEVLRNAILYSAKDSEVTVRLSTDGENALITVTDHGWGIDPKDQENIWNIMIQSDRKKREQQGAGMGLPLVKQIIKSHHGQVTLQSELNVGTVVTLQLPVYRGRH